MNKKALSLIEIIVSMIILAFTLASLVNLFISGKRWILLSRSRMTGGQLGRQFIDPLQLDVRQDQWGNNCVSRDGTNPAGCNTATWLDPQTNITYTPQYTNSNFNGLRRVRIDINWNEN